MFPKIDWSRFISYEYWFEGFLSGAGALSTTPEIPMDSWFFWFFIITFSAFISIGVLLKILQLFLHPHHPLQDRIPFFSNNIIWMGLLGVGWFLMRQLKVTFLGGRFWLLFGLVWIIFLLYLTLRYFIRFYRFEMGYFKKTYVNKA